MSFPPVAGSAREAIDHLREHGAALLPGLLSGDKLREAREAVYRAAAEDNKSGRRADDFALDHAGNVRVWNLLNRAALFSELVQHPIALTVLREVLGWPALLGNFSANIAEPGSQGGVLHADQIFLPTPWPAQPQGMNVAWLLDDFTMANGATEMVPDSHKFEHWHSHDAPAAEDAVSLVAPAGTAVVFESRVWASHGEQSLRSATRCGFAPGTPSRSTVPRKTGS